MKNKKHLNIIIVDDETNAREILKLMINRYDADCTVVAEADSVESAIQQINEHKPDLLFLDVELKNGDGFDVLEAVGDNLVPTVFVTAFDHYAIKAIKYNAFDYILKPVDYHELIASIQNARQSKTKKLTSHSLENYSHNKSVSKLSEYRIAVQNKGERLFIPLSEIVLCKAENSYTSLYLENGKNILSSKNLGEFEKIMPSADMHDDFFFYRIHHSTIINTKYISKYLPKNGMILLQNGQEVKISERRKSQFQKIMHLISNVM